MDIWLRSVGVGKLQAWPPDFLGPNSPGWAEPRPELRLSSVKAVGSCRAQSRQRLFCPGRLMGLPGDQGEGEGVGGWRWTAVGQGVCVDWESELLVTDGRCGVCQEVAGGLIWAGFD